MIKVENYMLVVVFFITHNVQQVLGEICSNGKTCSSPYKCCDGSCCHDNNDDDYIYGYRMSFWNLWYFWFIILFVLMSCFGGCGYYKQRQRIIRGQSGSPSHTNRRSRTIILTNTTETVTPYAYSGPGAEPYNNVFQPPPYSEVMLHPGLYPTNKENLPPYPEDSNQERTEAVPINNEVALPQPPPYTEIANQNTAHLQQQTYN